MTNKEILEKAIQKAIDGGWQAPRGNSYGVADDGTIFMYVKGSEFRAIGIETSRRELIFNHDFAKALWGEEWIDTGVPDGATWGEENIHELAWKYHLQMMVVADDPIKYLGENI